MTNQNFIIEHNESRAGIQNIECKEEKKKRNCMIANQAGMRPPEARGPVRSQLAQPMRWFWVRLNQNSKVEGDVNGELKKKDVVQL